MSDKRSHGYIADRDCPHAHALAACGGVACREHARIGYAPAMRDCRGGKCTITGYGGTVLAVCAYGETALVTL